MKRIITLALLLSSFVLFAQDDPNAAPKEESMAKKAKEKVVNTGAKDRLVVDLFSFDNWVHDVDSLNVDWYSRGFGMYFMYDIQLGKSRLSFAPGIGLNISNAYINTRLDDSVDSLGTILRPITTDYKRHKLHLLFIDIPVELRYRSKPNEKNKSFKFAIGAKFGLKIDAHTKLVADDANGDRKVEKLKNFNDLSLIRFGPMVRVGYGAFNVFAYYGVTNMFKKDEGPKITSFSVGFSINGL